LAVAEDEAEAVAVGAAVGAAVAGNGNGVKPAREVRVAAAVPKGRSCSAGLDDSQRSVCCCAVRRKNALPARMARAAAKGRRWASCEERAPNIARQRSARRAEELLRQ